MIRTRWAAVGAAVAVTLGAGGVGLVAATTPSDATTFIAITPCRVIDTRPTSSVGPKTSPLGPGEIHTVTTHGTNGDCTGIPNNAVAISMNMTTVDATARTFLTVWANGATQPLASSMNPSPGAPATPNAITTAVNGAGEFNVYNRAGNVHILADINGYYVDHHHDDRYYTKAEVDTIEARLLALETSKPFVVSSPASGIVAISTRTVTNSVQVTAPAAGRVFVTGSATAVENTGGDDVRCAISTVPNPLDSNYTDAIFEAAGVEGQAGGLARNRSFPIAAGATQSYYFSCASTGSPSQVWGAQVDAIFLPD